ncbi:MAG: hypothetical protein ACR2QF_07510 [Geminicoccaceae bacterium]
MAAGLLSLENAGRVIGADAIAVRDQEDDVLGLAGDGLPLELRLKFGLSLLEPGVVGKGMSVLRLSSASDKSQRRYAGECRHQASNHGWPPFMSSRCVSTSEGRRLDLGTKFA